MSTSSYKDEHLILLGKANGMKMRCSSFEDEALSCEDEAHLTKMSLSCVRTCLHHIPHVYIRYSAQRPLSTTPYGRMHIRCNCMGLAVE